MAAIPQIPVAQYLRVSAEHQQYSLEFQTAAIRSYAMQHNFLVVPGAEQETASRCCWSNRRSAEQHAGICIQR